MPSCLLHLLRHSLNFVSDKQRLAAAARQGIYSSASHELLAPTATVIEYNFSRRKIAPFFIPTLAL